MPEEKPMVIRYPIPMPSHLIADSLKRAGVHARTISYLEAHGTGTALGDPIEIAGLTRAFDKIPRQTVLRHWVGQIQYRAL